MSHEFPDPIPKPPKQESKSSVDRSLFIQSPEYKARARELYENEYVEPESPKVSEQECEQKIQEVIDLITAFETKHSIEKLLTITDLAPKDAPDHPLREPARKDLPAIGFSLRFLEEKTNISHEKYLEFLASYKRFIRAVGSIRNGKVCHD